MRSNAAQIEGFRLRALVVHRQSPLDAHEEEAQFVVLVLIGVQDVRAPLIEQRRNPGHQPRPVGTIDQQHRRLLFHDTQGSNFEGCPASSF